jgi:tRNA(fMet)-specific endonuclease VapC
MSLYILDTDILTLLQEGAPIVRQHVNSHPKQDIAITIISVEEQLTGWYTRIRRTKKPAMLAQVYEHLTRNVRYLAQVTTILSFTEPAILRFEQLKTLKLNVPGKDLRIAAITLEHSGILVSRNLRDFQRVPNLVVEDWSV